MTDSTSSLPADTAAQNGIRVVNMRLRIGDEINDESYLPTPRVVEAMRGRDTISVTAPPADAFYWAYHNAWDHGAESVVSLHASAHLSTVTDSALDASTRLAAPVHIVDSHSFGMTLGFATIAAARAAATGATSAQVCAVAKHRAKAARTLIYVDTLEHLSSTGHLRATTAFLGNRFAVKPLLTVSGGRVEPFGKVLGAGRAVSRLVEQALATAGERPVDVAVEHFAAREQGSDVLDQLRKRVPYGREFVLTQFSPAIGTSLGPGALAVTIAPL